LVGLGWLAGWLSLHKTTPSCCTSTITSRLHRTAPPANPTPIAAAPPTTTAASPKPTLQQQTSNFLFFHTAFDSHHRPQSFPPTVIPNSSCLRHQASSGALTTCRRCPPSGRLHLPKTCLASCPRASSALARHVTPVAARSPDAPARNQSAQPANVSNRNVPTRNPSWAPSPTATRTWRASLWYISEDLN